MKILSKPLFFLVMFSTTSLHAQTNTLKYFVTDGCTMFVDGPPSKPNLWKHCCLEHDMRYWFGGSDSELNTADHQLKSCVKDVAGSIWANLIYSGVRTGHNSPIKNKTHWSWGWNTERSNQPLSNAEKIYVTEEIRRLPYNAEILETFIERYLKVNNANL
jgi:hypothetical protein